MVCLGLITTCRLKSLVVQIIVYVYNCTKYKKAKILLIDAYTLPVIKPLTKGAINYVVST